MPSPATVVHLAGRFLRSLDPRPPSALDRAWVRDHLNEGEFAIWTAMSNPDQCHAIDVARAVEAEVGRNDRSTGDPDWPSAEQHGFRSIDERRAVMVAAALLHDSGKNVSGLSTLPRVAATLLRPAIDGATVARWSKRHGVRRRLSQYWRHPEIGAELLVAAESQPLVSTWAAEHHRSPTSWSVEPALGRILHDCDND